MNTGLYRVVLVGDAASIHLQRWATSLAERGHDITVMSESDWTQAPVNVVVIRPSTGPPAIRYIRAVVDGYRLRRAILQTNPDIIHLHYLRPSLRYLIATTNLRHVIITVWGSDILLSQSHPTFQWVRRLMLRRATIITASSRYLADRTQELSRRPVEVVPFGVDTSVFSPGTLPQPHGLAIAFIKKLRPIYGFDVLLRALAIVVRDYPDVHVLITDQADAQINGLVRSSGVQQNVTFVGRLTSGEVVELLRRSDLMVMPSRSESFGVAALEAAACGLPVVASRVGGLPEVVKDGVTGFLIPPGDAEALAKNILRLVGDEALRRNMGRAGREFVFERYRWDDSVEFMITLYQQCKKSV
ncbi:MAG: glycosyltransferase [Candidatus Kerfeldbacteria bacterium]|nr:glycosyltransferase [Candidatus Kerfeldbacteria bacterium]